MHYLFKLQNRGKRMYTAYIVCAFFFLVAAYIRIKTDFKDKEIKILTQVMNYVTYFP